LRSASRSQENDPTKLLVGQIVIVFGIVILGVWTATQWAAAMLGYQAQLGSPWIVVAGIPVYRPWDLFGWWYHYDAYADRPRPRPDDWGSEVRVPHAGLTAAEAEGAAFDEESEGGLQQQRHPGLPEEQAAQIIDRDRDGVPGDDDDTDPAADRRAMTALTSVARAVAMNEGKDRGDELLPSFGEDR